MQRARGVAARPDRSWEPGWRTSLLRCPQVEAMPVVPLECLGWRGCPQSHPGPAGSPQICHKKHQEGSGGPSYQNCEHLSINHLHTHPHAGFMRNLTLRSFPSPVLGPGVRVFHAPVPKASWYTRWWQMSGQCMSSNPSSSTRKLCGLGKATYTLCVQFPDDHSTSPTVLLG